MIRMGRSSKPEVNETHEPRGIAETPSFNYDPAQSSRAVSDSESMARDIKEGRLSGYVGAGTVLTGETSFEAMLRVDGHLTGRVTSKNGTLVIGSSGQVDANIAVSAAIINGTVNGDIVAIDKIQLGRTARVVGNIQTPRLVMDDGSVLDGNCGMLKSLEAAKQIQQEAQERYATAELEPIASSDADSDSVEIAEAASN